MNKTNDRRERQSANNKAVAYIAAGLVHAAIIGAMIFNFTSKPDIIEAQYAEKVDVVKATTVDESEIQRKENELKLKERLEQAKKQREQEELERLKKESSQEQKRIEELKEQQQQEQDKAAELEQQRKEIELKRRNEQEQQEKEELARKKRQEALKQKQRQEERKRKAELEEHQKELDRIKREEQEMRVRREMQQRLAREEKFQANKRAQQRATTLNSKYAALIKQRVLPKVTISPDFPASLSSQMNVKVSPAGVVHRVYLKKSSGNREYDRAVETAIYASSPLPIPSQTEDPEVNKVFQDMTLNFSISDR